MVDMKIRRIIKHLFYTDWQARRAFPQECLGAIESAIKRCEETHSGEIRFAVEGGLEGIPLLLGQTARQRAMDVFSQLRVWDTERNNGVLIYVLLADRAVEIVADRGIHLKAGSETWLAICRHMEAAFSKSAFRDGALQGIALVSETIAHHFSADVVPTNELPDTPVILGLSHRKGVS